MKNCWTGKIENGKIVLDLYNESLGYLQRMEGKRIIIDELKRKRSDRQNAYYWVYLGMIATDTGDTENDLHEYFKRVLLPAKIVTVLGKEIKLPASTTDLSKAQFGEYLDKICYLTGVQLPEIGY